MARRHKSSDFSHAVQFQIQYDTQDDYGAIQSTWSDRIKVGAKIVQVSMKDSVSAGFELNVEVLRITFPATKGTRHIDISDRVRVNNAGVYSIIRLDAFAADANFTTAVVRRVNID